MKETDGMAPPELTVIVAATRSMGIGFQGGLPWKGLRKEMQYFARVTQRPAPLTTALNAVIMGRKTWDSIPPSFRPLKNRLNIIISRSAVETPAPSSSSQNPSSHSPPSHNPSASSSSPPLPPIPPNHEIRVPSIQAAVQYAQQNRASRIFIIGGAAIYRAALDMPTTHNAHIESSTIMDRDGGREPPAAATAATPATALPRVTRILLTSIEKDFECDTFFPLDPRTAQGWRRSSAGELGEWTGERNVDGVKEEAGVHYEFQMWERE